MSEFIVVSKDELKDLIFEGIKNALKLYAGGVNKQPATSIAKKMLSIEEASKLTKLSKSRLYVLAGNGTIPNFKQGSRVKFYEDELITWMESGRRHSFQEIEQMADSALLKGDRN